MQLTEIIETYEAMGDSADAVRFILKEFQGENARALQERYVPMVMLGTDGYGYDPISDKFYEVDPDVESSNFYPKDGQFLLFHKKGILSNAASAKLEEQGKQNFIQKLQIVGKQEILHAHVYISKHKEEELLRQVYAQHIRYANELGLNGFIANVLSKPDPSQ